jgi:ABC-2 type transport system ATP-binding protein
MKNKVILQVTELSKKYGSAEAVDHISFCVRPGEIVGLLGPNGAGKTTTINMILGVLEPSSGTIEVLGKDMGKNRAEAIQYMNFSAVYAELPGNLTVWQNLYVFSLLYSIKNIKDRIAVILKKFDLERFSKTKAGLLSSGEHSRLNMAKAVLNDPCLLLLDEPTASLDPSAASLMREDIKKYVQENQAGILWTSHNMQEVEAVCDRVMFISHGKIILEGDTGTLAAKHGKKNLEELFIAVAREPLALEI